MRFDRMTASLLSLPLHSLSLAQNASIPTYKDAYASSEFRVFDLLSRMTLSEKTAQLIQGDIRNWINDTTNAFNASGLSWSMSERSGSYYVGIPVPQGWISEGVTTGQKYLVQNTSLGIPAFVQTEGIHGLLIGNATIFNSPIGQACSFNPDLIKQMGAVIGQEARAIGVNQILGPLADLARELRYGRVEETYGEDGYLAGVMAGSYVEGLQAQNVSAMVKHFAGFSAPEQGLNTGPVHGGEREYRTTWLPSFHRAIIEAGATAIMAAYHSYDGIPAVANYHSLTEILRDEWGYEYFVMSDAGGTDRLCNPFKMCAANPTDSDAVTMLALPAGCDVEMGGGSYNYHHIPGLVGAGKLNESLVDQAVSRFLLAKFKMGLFETPYPTAPVNQTSTIIHTEAAVNLSRQLDAESIVLLSNHNATLPLSKNATIAVIGPFGDVMNYGDYTVHPAASYPQGVTPLEGITSTVATAGGSVTFSKGCLPWSNDATNISSAVTTALAADIAIVVIGTWSRDQTELWEGLNATTGEHVDVSSLDLIGAQSALVHSIIATNTPTVVIISSGKPITSPTLYTSASAILQQFYPGEQGGHALASILFGDTNPSGKLSVGIPSSAGALPTYYDYLNSGRAGYTPLDSGYIASDGSIIFGHQYVIGSPTPIYPFGYGLSYSTFTYSNVTLTPSNTTLSATQSNQTITASITITNNSTIPGQEVVQLYISDLIASVVVPNMQLKGFKKVFVPAGEAMEVDISFSVNDLGLWDQKMQYVVERGEFKVMMGGSSRMEDLRNWAILNVG